MSNVKLKCLHLQLWVFLSLLYACPLLGLEMKSIYDIEVPVQHQGAVVEQKALIQQAFQQVLIRVGGSEQIIQHPEIAQSITKADDYVKQFAYHTQAPDHTRMLRIQFNEKPINELLRKSGARALGKSRPSVLVWLVIKADNTEQWISGDSEMVQQLNTAALTYSIPLIFPLLDLTEATLVSEQNVLAETAPFLEASKRYNAKTLLMGRLSKQPSGWYGEWKLIQGSRTEAWDSSAPESNAVIAEGMKGLINRIADHSVEAPKDISHLDAVQRVRIAVAGIAGFDQYSEVLEYLRKLPDVKMVDVVEISPEQTLFNIETKSQDSLRQAIAEGSYLVESTPHSSSNILSYKMAGIL